MLPSPLVLGAGWDESTVFTRHFARQFKKEASLLDSNKV